MVSGLMKIYQLTKSVLSFRNNAVEFLNGLTTNDMDKPWNAFVDIHGRIIAVFDQIKMSDEEVWCVVETNFAEDVLSHIDRYAKLSGVKVERKDNYHVYFDLDGDALTQKGDNTISQKKGRLLITQRVLSANVSEEEFTLFRVKNNIPWLGVDFQKDEFLLNVSETDHVSYTKGCFLGQEPIAKVHSRSKPSWRLVVKAEEECNEEEKQKMTSKVKDHPTGKILGFVFVRNL